MLTNPTREGAPSIGPVPKKRAQAVLNLVKFLLSLNLTKGATAPFWGQKGQGVVSLLLNRESSPCCAKSCGPPPRLALPPPSASIEDGCTALSFLMSLSLHSHQPCPR